MTSSLEGKHVVVLAGLYSVLHGTDIPKAEFILSFSLYDYVT